MTHVGNWPILHQGLALFSFSKLDFVHNCYAYATNSSWLDNLFILLYILSP